MNSQLSKLITIALLLAACGDDAQPPSKASGDSADAGMKTYVEPPKDYYNALLTASFRGLKDQDEAARGNPVIYLNYGGASIDRGYEAGESFVLCNDQANIPGAGFSAADENTVTTRVAAMFAEKSMAVDVVDTAPVTGSYTMIVVGGSLADLGCAEQENVKGIAPLDRGNANASDIGFVFTKFDSATETVATAAFTQAGHTLGVVDGAGDDGLLYKTGLNLAAAQDATNITLPQGLEIIAGLAQLLADLAAGQKLDISNLLPLIDALFPGGLGGITGGVGQLPDLTKIGGLSGLTEIISVLGIANSALTNPANNNPGLIGKLGNLGAIIAIFKDLQAGGLKGLLDLIKIGNPGDLIKILQDLLNGKKGGANAEFDLVPVDRLPECDLLLGLKFADTATLLAHLKESAALINKNFSGDTQEALLSLLKVAYAQAYKKIK